MPNTYADALRGVSEAVLIRYLEKQSPNGSMVDPVEWIEEAILNHGPNIGGIEAVQQLVDAHPNAKYAGLFTQALAKIHSETNQT